MEKRPVYDLAYYFKKYLLLLAFRFRYWILRWSFFVFFHSTLFTSKHTPSSYIISHEDIRSVVIFMTLHYLVSSDFLLLSAFTIYIH